MTPREPIRGDMRNSASQTLDILNAMKYAEMKEDTKEARVVLHHQMSSRNNDLVANRI